MTRIVGSVTTIGGVTHQHNEGHGVETSVNPQGRVTIPAQLRREAGIETGTPLLVYVEDGRVIIESRERLAERTRRELDLSWRGHDSVVDELIMERRADSIREDQE